MIVYIRSKAPSASTSQHRVLGNYGVRKKANLERPRQSLRNI